VRVVNQYLYDLLFREVYLVEAKNDTALSADRLQVRRQQV